MVSFRLSGAAHNLFLSEPVQHSIAIQRFFLLVSSKYYEAHRDLHTPQILVKYATSHNELEVESAGQKLIGMQS